MYTVSCLLVVVSMSLVQRAGLGAWVLVVPMHDAGYAWLWVYVA